MLVDARDLVDRADHRCGSKIDAIVPLFNLPDLAVCLDHGFFETGVHEVDLVGPAREVVDFTVAERRSRSVFDGVENLPCGLFLESFLHATETHVLEIFEPLEVGDRDPASVDKRVRHHHDAALVKVLAGFGCDGAVGRFGDYLGLDTRHVVHRDGVF